MTHRGGEGTARSVFSSCMDTECSLSMQMKVVEREEDESERKAHKRKEKKKMERRVKRLIQ